MIIKKYRTLHVVFALAIFFLTTGKIMAQNKELAYIDVKPEKDYSYDSVEIKFWKEYFPYMLQQNLTKLQSFKAGELGQVILDDMNGRGLFYCVVYAGNEIIATPYCPISPGDKIILEIGSQGMTFTGKGATKMSVSNQLDKLQKRLRDEYYDRIDKQCAGNTFWESAQCYFSKPLDSLLNVKLDFLDKYKKELEIGDYLWLKSATISYDYYRRSTKFGTSQRYGLSLDSTKRPVFVELYLKHLKKLSIKGISDSILASTPYYLDFIEAQRLYGANFDTNFPKIFKDRITFASTFSPALRDQLITSYLLNKEISKLDKAEVDRAISHISSLAQKDFLNSLRKNIEIGKPAYNFELEDTQGKVVHLNDFKGKVVFMDFWFTGCKWCKQYYADKLKAVEEHFQGSKDIIFLSISVDAKKSLWLKSVNSGEYNGVSSVNLYTRGNGYQDPLLLHYNIKGYPTQIIVDPELNNYNINQVRLLSVEKLISYLNKLIEHNRKTALK